MMRSTPILLLAVLFPLASSARADELHLKEGRILEGRLVSRAGGKVVFERFYGTITVSEDVVARIVRKRCVFDEYDELAAALRDGRTAGRLALAAWCKSHGLRRRMKRQLDELLKIEPDHARARALLGHIRVRGRWLPEDEARRLLGMRWRDGRWVSAAEDRRREEKAAAARRRGRLQSRVNTLVSRLYSPSDRTSARARDRLVELARKEKISRLEPLAHQLHAHASAWRDSLATATVEVRAQMAQLGGFRNLPLSLGPGASVNLQLPRTRLVGVGTTVSVPLR